MSNLLLTAGSFELTICLLIAAILIIIAAVIGAIGLRAVISLEVSKYRGRIMLTSTRKVNIDEKDVLDKDGTKLSIKGEVAFKIMDSKKALSAAENILDRTDQEISSFGLNLIQNFMRYVVGKLSINEILKDRDSFNKRVIEESRAELGSVGMMIIYLSITELTEQK